MSVRLLPDYLINQIAAGEVVESGASVVKEVVENALDAGADQILIDVVDGGRTLINVVDNGSGMSRQDLSACIQRHATSKLPTDDLLDIKYMGFRGEALPSTHAMGWMQTVGDWIVIRAMLDRLIGKQEQEFGFLIYLQKHRHD